MIFIKNATYIDSETLEFKKTGILVNKDNNGTIIFTDNIPAKAEIIDAEGKYVTKSFVCGHHHAYSALAKGMPAPKKTPGNFYEILQYVWWNIDKALTPEMIKASALVTALESAKSGVSFIIDHHASPFTVEGSLEIIADAFEQVGVSHLLCYEISDRDGKKIRDKGLEETENYLKQKPGLVGLHASFTLSNHTLEKAVALAEKYNSGIHVHTAEDLYDQEYTKQNFGLSVIERFNKFGVLKFSKTILAHCLHLSDKERKIVAESPSRVVENMESNLNNNVGYFNGNNLGENIFLGTDGMHSDMLRSAKAAFFAGQRYDNIDFASTYQRLRNVHKYLDVNKFNGDSSNNLIIFDYPSPTPFNKENFLGHFIFGLESKHISHVISSGNLIVKNGETTKVNEEEILEFAQEQAKKLWVKL